MPVATVLIRDGAVRRGVDANALVEAWGQAAGIGAADMTVNVIEGVGQGGTAYDATATLYLPDVWGTAAIGALQTGLSAAIESRLGLGAERILVITQMVASGHVVEAGRIQSW